MKRVGFLTSGGDCQALNAAMRGVVKSLWFSLGGDNVEIYGFYNGYRGLIYSNYKQLTYEGYKQIEESNGILSVDEVEVVPIFNGQRGVVVDILEKVMVVKFDEELVVYDKLTVYNLLLGYAISTFAAQGQEAPYVINVVSESHNRLMSKNLNYVADTRSKKKQIDIGQVKAYKDSLLVDNVEERNTWLLDLLVA